MNCTPAIKKLIVRTKCGILKEVWVLWFAELHGVATYLSRKKSDGIITHANRQSFSINTFMKLTEIIKVPEQVSSGFDLSQIDTTSIKQLTTAENMPVFHFSLLGDATVQGYGIQMNGTFVSFILGKWGHLGDDKVFYIKRTYTEPPIRNKGIMTSLYVALIDRLYFILCSDGELSPQTIAIWSKISNQCVLKTFNSITKQLLDFDQTTSSDLYNNKDILFVAYPSNPQRHDKTEAFHIPGRPLIDTILGDYTNYTHVINEGLYE